METKTGQRDIAVDPAASPKRSRRRRRSSGVQRAVLAGLMAAVLAGSCWALIIFAFEIRLGYLAIAVGASVGWAVRNYGRGRSEIFGLIAILCALLGCAIGDILGGCALLAGLANVPFLDVLTSFNGKAFAEVLHLMFSPMDAVFYLIALFASYRFAVIADDF
jgi:hypothetical protein